MSLKRSFSPLLSAVIRLNFNEMMRARADPFGAPSDVVGMFQIHHSFVPTVSSSCMSVGLSRSGPSVNSSNLIRLRPLIAVVK